MSDPILDSLDAASASAEQSAKVKRASDLIQHVRVENPEGTDLVPMEAWPLTVELLDVFWPGHKRTVVIKARQLGVSWAFALYCLWRLGWHRHQTLGSINYNQKAASELIRRMRVLWQTLPAAMRPEAKWTDDSVAFANGSRGLALPTTDVGGAGLTFSVVGIDEAGLIKRLGDNWAAILPAVEKGQLHAFSTPRDNTGKFAQLVGSARKGEGSFALREIRFDERPDRDQTTDAGRAWLAARKAEISPKEFAREYELQFARPGSVYFDDDLLARLREGCKAPLEVLWHGRLKIWARPVSGHAYDIGADVAEGLEDGDYSAAAVRDKSTGEIVATYHGHVTTIVYATELVTLAQLYNNAMLAIEANNHGHAVCAWAYHHLGYKKLHRETGQAEGALGKAMTRLGLLTTGSSKVSMLGQLDNALRKGTLVPLDIGFVEEMGTYLCLPDGGYGAAPGCHDDRVMAHALSFGGRFKPAPKYR